jgi:hypothetical protein
MLRSGQDGFILDDQWDRQEELKIFVQRREQQTPGCATFTTESGHNHIGVENESQAAPAQNTITCNSTKRLAAKEGNTPEPETFS